MLYCRAAAAPVVRMVRQRSGAVIAVFALLHSATGFSPAALRVPAVPHARAACPTPRALRATPLSARMAAGADVVDEVRDAFAAGVVQLNQKADMKTALSGVIDKTSDAFAAGMRSRVSALPH